MTQSSAQFSLSPHDIRSALTRMGELAAARGTLIELNVYGGAALAIAYDLRPATIDVDAVARHDPALVRELARRVAAERNFPEDWLNDGVKGFLSEHGEAGGLRSAFEAHGIRVQVPSVEYLLAMKAIAMRLDDAASSDRQDVVALIARAGLRTADEVLDLVAAHYPVRQIPRRTVYAVQEIMDELQAANRGAT